MPRYTRRNSGCRICDRWTYHGIPTLLLENDLLRVVVLSGKGADIIEFLYKPADLDCMWSSPAGLSAPGRRPAGAPWDEQFGDFYEGGWQEIFPHGSRPAPLGGVSMPMHGEVWALPWDVEILEDRPEMVRARLTVHTRRTPFRLERTMTLRRGQPVLELDERLTHLGEGEGPPLHVMWGHHPAFGAPLLSHRARLFTGARSCRHKDGPIVPWPGREADYSRVPAEEGGFEDMVYLVDYPGNDGWYALVDPDRRLGFGMVFDPKLFPVTWVWRNIRGPEAPWFGRCYVMAIEPFTSFPGAAENETERLSIQPGQTVATRMLAMIVTGVSEVSRIRADGTVEGG